MGIELNNDQLFASYEAEHWWKTQNKQRFEIAGGAGTGKAQPIYTMIPTPSGWKMLGELKVGDLVFNQKGFPTKIKGIYKQGFLEDYRVSLANGKKTHCHIGHLWSYYKDDGDELIVDELGNIMNEMLNRENGYHRYYLPNCDIVNYPPYDEEIDFYELGKKIFRIMLYYSEDHDNMLHNPYDFQKYIFSSKEERIDLINGILDICGYVKENGEIICDPPQESVIYFVENILDTFGCNYELSENGLRIFATTSLRKHLFRNTMDKNAIKKTNHLIDDKEFSRTEIVSIWNTGNNVEMACIYVEDPEHLYLTNDYIVTHNTTMIMYFIERVGLSLDEVLFVSYMGKAVSRMIQTGLPARTIHSTCYTYEKEVDRDENGKIIFRSNGKPKMVWVQTLKDHLPKKIKLIVVDEGFTVPERNAIDILSFEIPVVVLGDINQLPPPFGKPYFLFNPDVILYQIMRQAENDPIIYIAQCILNGETLRTGVYGNSMIIRKSDLTDFTLKSSDVIITATNRLRGHINTLFRENFYQFPTLEIPHIGEKIICRRNNWGKFINNHGEIYLTNGTTGYVDFVDKRSYNGKSISIDFRPEFSKRAFHSLKIDAGRLNRDPALKEDDTWIPPDTDVFEYAYALTTASAQGSQWDKVCVLQEENYFRNREDYKKLLYTAVTRAIKSVYLVLE